MALVDLGPPEFQARATAKGGARPARPLALRWRSWRDMGLVVVAWGASWALVILAAIGVARLL